LFSEAERLSTYRFDLAIVLRFDHWWGAWLAHRAGIPVRIGYDIAEVSPFLTQSVPYIAGRHEVLQNLQLIESAVGQTGAETDLDLDFEPSSEDEVSASELLAAEGVNPGDSLGCVHPGAGARIKLWHNEGWAKVIEALAREHGLKVLVTGGPGEMELVNDLMHRLSVPAANMAGRTNIGQLAAIMGRCRLVLGTDSGPLHLAAAMGTPTIHLFGPADSRLFGPWGDARRHIVLTSTRACVPCGQLDRCVQEPASQRCTLDITVEQVLQAVREIEESETQRTD
jgi:heptosyltransferase-2/heptosyltransferase-3